MIQVRTPSITSLLKQCLTMTDVKQIHARVIKTGGGKRLFLPGKIIGFCASSQHGDMDYAVSVFRTIKKPDRFIWNSMIRGFCESLDEKTGFQYLKEMQQMGISPDNFTFTFLIKSCGNLGDVKGGRQLHCSVLKYGFKSSVFVMNTLIHMCGTFQQIKNAWKVFDEMIEPGSVAWNTILNCHFRLGEHEKVLELYELALQERIQPDEATLVVTLSACSKLGALSFGRSLHDSIRNTSLINSFSVKNALMDMYAKCGEVKEAVETFAAMKVRNVVAWNTIILGLATHGHADEALRLFSMILTESNQKPDEVTFLGALYACTHCGLVDEGKKYFQMMREDFDLEPNEKHYGSMVDMLGKAGLLVEAYEFVENMRVECSSVLWRTLLSACKVHGNVEIGEKVVERVIAFESDHSSDYVLLSNMYAGAGKWSQVVDVRKSMRDRQVEKPKPGQTSLSSMPPLPCRAFTENPQKRQSRKNGYGPK